MELISPDSIPSLSDSLYMSVRQYEGIQSIRWMVIGALCIIVGIILSELFRWLADRR